MTIFIALGVGYVSLVFKVEDIIIQNFVNSFENLKNRGVNVDYKIEKGDFSFIPNILIKDLRISKVKSDEINAFEVPEILVELNPFQKYPVKLTFKNNIKFLSFDRELDFIFKKAFLEISFYKGYKVKDLKIVANDISINESVENLSFVNHLVANFSFLNEGHKIEFDANGIALRNEKVDGIYFKAVLNKSLDFSISFNRIFNEFYSKGGFIFIEKGGFSWLPLKISFDGEIVLNDSLNILVSLNSNIYGFNDGINMLEEKGFISQKENWLSKIVLFVMARKDDDGEDFIPTKINYNNKQIFVGPILFYEF